MKLAETIYGKAHVPATAADKANKDAWCCKQMCSLVKLKVRKLKENGKWPRCKVFRELMDLIMQSPATQLVDYDLEWFGCIRVCWFEKISHAHGLQCC